LRTKKRATLAGAARHHCSAYDEFAVTRLPMSLLAALLALGLCACSLASGGGNQPSGPTPVPEPPAIRALPGRGVAVEGHGTSTSDEISPQYGSGITLGIDVVTLTHDGRSSFIVTAVQGDQTEIVASAIGSYRGQRPLVVEGPVSFQVTADGAWTLKVQPIASGAKPPFSGSGDAVSAYFTPPGPTTWDVSHDGQSNFFVFAHCGGGSIVVEDKSGAFQDAIQLEFPRGPCFWEVRADGAWSMTPRS
jgi:hypothetical protein